MSSLREFARRGRSFLRHEHEVLEHGAAGLVSKKRGRPSNRRLPQALRQRSLALVRERYADFGPTLAQEKLEELHDLCVSVETLRKWMTEDELWVPRALRHRPPHQPRRRRECLGELVQIDGCEHAWFEDRGPICTLLVFVDDLTLNYKKVIYMVKPSVGNNKLRGHHCDIFEWEDGFVELWCEGRRLPYSIFTKEGHVQQAEIVDNKRLGVVLEKIGAESRVDPRRSSPHAAPRPCSRPVALPGQTPRRLT